MREWLRWWESEEKRMGCRELRTKRLGGDGQKETALREELRAASGERRDKEDERGAERREGGLSVLGVNDPSSVSAIFNNQHS